MGPGAASGGPATTFARRWGTVVDPAAYEWDGDRRSLGSSPTSIIYELHVAGFTTIADLGGHRCDPETFAGLQDKTRIWSTRRDKSELLPIFQFDATTDDFWGYNPVGQLHTRPQRITARGRVGNW